MPVFDAHEHFNDRHKLLGERTMSRPVTLFTGQWADLPLEIICQKASKWGYDGIELPCWGDHFNVQKALSDDGYCKGRHELLGKYGLKTWAISNHLVGQAVCDLIDERHKLILPEHVWGDGKPEAVRQRAAKEMMDTARPRPSSASRSSTASPARRSGTCSTRSRRSPTP